MDILTLLNLVEKITIDDGETSLTNAEKTEEE